MNTFVSASEKSKEKHNVHFAEKTVESYKKQGAYIRFLYYVWGQHIDSGRLSKCLSKQPWGFWAGSREVTQIGQEKDLAGKPWFTSAGTAEALKWSPEVHQQGEQEGLGREPWLPSAGTAGAFGQESLRHCCADSRMFWAGGASSAFRQEIVSYLRKLGAFRWQLIHNWYSVNKFIYW